MRAPMGGVRRHGFRVLVGLGATAWLCGHAPNSIAEDTSTTTQQIASVNGGHEAAIDAPWRLEPDPDSNKLYPKIPIVVSIHDASLPRPPAALGDFCELAILEGDPTPHPPLQFRTASALDEIERSDVWGVDDVAANHRICRPASGQACPEDYDVGSSAEWHGTVLYTPRTQTPGTDVSLTVQVRVARQGFSCASPQPIVNSASFDRLELHPADPNSYIMTNRLLVHLGEEALPRFDHGWVYGDLHYHSQGTDNEGESAYAYRPTLQAMRAMGLDFLFATEHASNSSSGQMTDIDLIYLRNIDLPDWLPLDGELESLIESIPLPHEQVASDAGRDMSPERFATLRAWINGPDGANAQVMKVPGRSRAPRLFLGGEVDVKPEISTGERSSHQLVYGNGRVYDWRSGCIPTSPLMQLIQDQTDVFVCASLESLAVPASEGGRFLLKDLQGLSDSYFARQHMIHLPTDAMRDDAFVSSGTSLFGGAARRLGPAHAPAGQEGVLQSVLYHDYAVGQKGYTFLAHPVDAASGVGLSRLGPDIVPYSDVQLRTAFESPSMLGLQLWNEDTRLRSTTPLGFPLQVGQPSVPVGDVDVQSMWQWRSWYGPAPDAPYRDLHDGLAAWDKMLLWGIRASQTEGLEGLTAGVRRVFIAGGSDAHGDWNYRREGRMGGLSRIVDTAIGKPRNLVYVGPERPESVVGPPPVLYPDVTIPPPISYGAVGQEQVTSALASGNFAVTDGPALRIALDTNGNGDIDDGDVPMGGVAPPGYRGVYVPFVVEWKSTDEFGPVQSIDLYVGVANDDTDAGLVYAAENHGIHSASTPSGARGAHPYVDRLGGLHWQLQDGYMLDSSGRLHVTPTAAEAKAGRRRVWIRANDYPAGEPTFRAAQSEQCTPNYAWCTNGHAPDDHEAECEWECTPATPASYHFYNAAAPDRMFVRAFARTAPRGEALCAQTGLHPDDAALAAQQSGRCIERLAFTNPIWVDNTVPPGDFSITCAPATLTPQDNTSTCTVTALSGVPGQVSLHSGAGLPAGTACSFSPATVTLSANGSAQSTLTVSVGLVGAGIHGFQASASTPAMPMGRSTSLVLTVGGQGGGGSLTAVFDAGWRAPNCGDAIGSSCDTGPSLVRGRSAVGREPNVSNTIGASCTDGTSSDPAGTRIANDRLVVATVDQTGFAPGKEVRIDATVSASSSASVVDFFYAPDADRPIWTLVDTVASASEGTQTLSAFYRLPAGGRQAVRVQLRHESTEGSCASGDYNDRDDLIFAVRTAGH